MIKIYRDDIEWKYNIAIANIRILYSDCVFVKSMNATNGNRSMDGVDIDKIISALEDAKKLGFKVILPSKVPIRVAKLCTSLELHSLLNKLEE